LSGRLESDTTTTTGGGTTDNSQRTALPAVQTRTAQCACAAYVAVRPTHRYTILTLALAFRPRTVGNDEKIREAIAKRRQTRETKRANVSVNLDFEILIAKAEECTQT